MRTHRTFGVFLLALAAACLVWWWRSTEGDPGSGHVILRGDEAREPPSLVGYAPDEGAALPEEEGAPTASVAAAPGEAALWNLEVLDYRNAGVAGVQVFYEVDLLPRDAAGGGVGWRTLASGTTDAAGHVGLALDRMRRRQSDEGPNHRIRVVPPAKREDLAPTWRLWSPEQGVRFFLTQTHVVAGRVLDAAGEPVWDATVWVGDLREGIRVQNPGWRKTRSDIDGHFRFAGLPTTSDWQIEVWAVGPGEQAPASSSDVHTWVSVALGSRTVELRLP